MKKEENLYSDQEQPSRNVPRKKCSANMQQIYRRRTCRRTNFTELQSNFIEITLQHRCSPVNMLHIFRTAIARTPLEDAKAILSFLAIFVNKGLPVKTKLVNNTAKDVMINDYVYLLLNRNLGDE